MFILINNYNHNLLLYDTLDNMFEDILLFEYIKKLFEINLN